MISPKSKLIALLLFSITSGPVPRAYASGIWLDVPYVKQEKNGCGAAALSMLIQYWALKIEQVNEGAADPQRILSLLYTKEADGIFASDLQRYLQQNGFKTYVFKGDWKDLAQHLKKGRPLIVCLDENSKGGPLHYVVVAGIDSAEGYVLLNDPAQRKLLKLSRAAFEKSWMAMGNWVLLAVPDVQ